MKKYRSLVLFVARMELLLVVALLVVLVGKEMEVVVGVQVLA